MSVMMNPVLTVPGPEISIKRSEVGSQTDSSFASHLDRQLDNKYGSNRDKFGVANRDDVKVQGNEQRDTNQDDVDAKDNMLGVAEQDSVKNRGNKHGVVDQDDVNEQGIMFGVAGQHIMKDQENEFDVVDQDGVEVQDYELGVANQDGVKEQVVPFQRSDAQVKNKDQAGAVQAGIEKDGEQNESLVDLLAQFMAELQEVAEKNTGLPGEWNVDLPDLGVLKQLAIDAGMGEEGITLFMQQFDNQDKKVSLPDFFAALNQYFQEVNENPPVTVPETELPVLETILAQMGFPREEIAEISRQAVNGNGKLDLTKFLQGLETLDTQNVAEVAPIVLTEFEGEQLQNILAQAGVTLEDQNELLPERFLNQVLGTAVADEEDNGVQLSLDRLKNILQQAVADVKAREPELNLPAFLTDLQKIVSQSGFESQLPGWTPVVQKSVSEIFNKLQELVDLAKIKVEENKFVEEHGLDADYLKWVKAVNDKFSSNTSGQDSPADFSGGNFNGKMNEDAALMQGVSSQTPGASQLSGMQSTTVVDSSQDMMSAPDAARANIPRSPSNQLQQQVVQQLSAGVMRGLKSQEHHMVLRLYPQDLGEVKVNLTVQNEQVSVSFKMENVKVKEMLESNMQEFKDSMNQKGFTLEDCFVSTGEQEDAGELWQRFEMARKTIEAARETVADLPDSALYHRAEADRMSNPENGISLVV